MTFYSCAMSIEADLAQKCTIESLNGLKSDFGGLNWPRNPTNFHLKAWFNAFLTFFHPVTYVYVDWGRVSSIGGLNVLKTDFGGLKMAKNHDLYSINATLTTATEWVGF